MNYKTIDVACVIGAMFSMNLIFENISSTSISDVFNLVHERDKFICIDASRSAYLRVLDIADGSVVLNGSTIHFIDDSICKSSFLACYYSVDNQTRDLLKEIVGEEYYIKSRVC